MTSATAAHLTTHDTTRIDDTRISAVRPLITPAPLEEKLPASRRRSLVEASRAAISDVCTAATTASSWWWGRVPSTTTTRPWTTRAS